jgi:hypothetical protein
MQGSVHIGKKRAFNVNANVRVSGGDNAAKVMSDRSLESLIAVGENQDDRVQRRLGKRIA